MTKLRAPLTFDSALSRIAGVLTWERMAELVGMKERTVRDWGDPDIGRGIPIQAALTLDLAYLEAGGEGRPLFDTYDLLVGQAHAEHFACQIELTRRTIDVIKEGGDAEAALVAATIPGATDRDRAAALREVEQALAALRATLPLLTSPPAPPPP